MTRWLSLFDVLGISLLVPIYIWRLQASSPRTWMVFPVWLVGSFLLHRDNPKTLGWRADNLWPATRQAAMAFALAAFVLFALGLVLDAGSRLPPNLLSLRRLVNYAAFCLLQQVALQSFLNNRLMHLVPNRVASSLLAGAIFAAMHWPNPVLMPLTFLGGSVMAWLFARQRNVLPLVAVQALLSAFAWWAFPVAWHHNFRVGPGYYSYQ